MKKILAALVIVALAAGAADAQKRKRKAGAAAGGKPPAAGAWKKTPGLYAHFKTSMGDFVAQLFEKEAPETVAAFAGLASGNKEFTDVKTGEAVTRPFYDGLTFHRVVRDYIIQSGDPKGDSTGGPGWTFEDEINGLAFDRPGRLAMANSGPDTNGSQFFVTVTPIEQLNDVKTADGKLERHYTIFGQVVDGLPVVEAISRAPATAEAPNTPITLKKLDILRVEAKGRVTAMQPAAPEVEAAPVAKKEEAAPAKKPAKKGKKKAAAKKKAAPKAQAAPALPGME